MTTEEFIFSLKEFKEKYHIIAILDPIQFERLFMKKYCEQDIWDITSIEPFKLQDVRVYGPFFEVNLRNRNRPNMIIEV